MIQKLGPQPDLIASTGKVGQEHFKIAQPDLPQLDFRARLIHSVEELEQQVEAWNRLGEMAVRTNPFFNPDFLIPAFEHLGNGKVSVLIVDAPQRTWADGPRVMCALIPIIKRRFYGLPLSCYEIWKHDQCFDCTPLIRKDCGAEVLQFVFDHLSQTSSLLSLDTICGENEFARLLTDNFYQTDKTVFYRDAFSRACFYPSSDAEVYIMSEVAKNTRKGTQRLERRLAESGELETRFFSPEDDPEIWAEEFLAIESTGWKGANNTSLASAETDRKFFLEMTKRSAANGRLAMVKVQLDGQPVAMLCDLNQGDYAVHFKTTFDEAFSKYTPGLILELKNIHRLHAANISVMDSCADPDHSMINRVWSGRTRYQSLVVALGGNVSKLAASLMPLIQFVSKFRK